MVHLRKKRMFNVISSRLLGGGFVGQKTPFFGGKAAVFIEKTR